MSGLVEAQENALVHQDQSAVLSIIQAAARDPNVDIDKMERLLQMHERMVAKNAEVEFANSLSQMQQELPVIRERGAIKNKNGGDQSTYALWEDINEEIKPVLARHGFSLSFRSDTSQGITVIGVLTHRAGHKETTSILLPADNSGSKNTVQAIASSISYGKRYTAGCLLNFTSTGEDDDGQSACVVASSLGTLLVEKAKAASTTEALTQVWQSGIKDAKQVGDKQAYEMLKTAVEAKGSELKGLGK
ncbi:MAG: ERF family protein [bacterium]|nr:ERF family protein [bacterium]